MKQPRITQVEQRIDELVELLEKLSAPQQAMALQRLRIRLDLL